MSSTGIELVFEGQELESGRIDAGVLGSALAGYSEVFRRANQLVNGEASEGMTKSFSDGRRTCVRRTAKRMSGTRRPTADA